MRKWIYNFIFLSLKKISLSYYIVDCHKNIFPSGFDKLISKEKKKKRKVIGILNYFCISIDY